MWWLFFHVGAMIVARNVVWWVAPHVESWYRLSLAMGGKWRLAFQIHHLIWTLQFYQWWTKSCLREHGFDAEGREQIVLRHVIHGKIVRIPLEKEDDGGWVLNDTMLEGVRLKKRGADEETI